MGSCISAAAASSPPSCSLEEKEFYEWQLGLREHRISQLRIKLRQVEGGISFKTALTGIAERYGQADVVGDTRQILRDLAVLNYHQRVILDNLACVPTPRRVPRVHFN